ncbi:MAG: CD225/dispanin family protein [Bacteroides sp.]|nr:CD225/dispanin family protein [Bacteroides sp.]MCM1379164.1 CD225/dispanin family protein [Bacteroides sp.]MCM1445187.1 CD225/dispanin family protein [Prevotella sp.]
MRRDFTAALPVWCSDFSDWTTAGEVEELAFLITEDEEPTDNEEAEEKAAPEAKFENFFENIRQQQQQRQPWINAIPEEINGVKRPKSYMGWNIVMLLCCCMPAAVVGMIFSSQVNRKWMQGDAEGAMKASEYAQWCIILSFVLGLVAWPFQMLFI